LYIGHAIFTGIEEGIILPEVFGPKKSNKPKEVKVSE
jgi:hypothetical protein